jgi:hypothetical protein
MIGEDEVVTAAKARRTLDNACEDLDDAVRALPESSEDDVLASPSLVALLLRVVVARRQLAAVESFVLGVSGASTNRRQSSNLGPAQGAKR